MRFRTCENFGESTDPSLVLSPKFSQIQKPHRHYFDCDYAKANRLRIKRESLQKSFCYFLLSQKVESSLPLNFNLPNDADFALDSTIPQNLIRKVGIHPRFCNAESKRFCSVWLLPKVESSLPLKTQIHQAILQFRRIHLKSRSTPLNLHLHL